MSPSQPRLPKYRKHRSGQARVTINGRDYYLGLHGSVASKHEYDRVCCEYLASGRSPDFGREPEAYTIAMLVDDYLRHCRAYYGTGKTSEYLRIKPAVKLLAELYADFDAAEFGPANYKAIRQLMIDKGWSRPYVNECMKKLKRAFKWCASEGKIPAAVFSTLDLIPSLKSGRTTARETEPVLPVGDEVVEAILPHLPPIIADMVRVQRILGCRPGEVCNLTPGSLDRTEDVWIATIVEHKTKHHGHTRKLYVGPLAQAILTPYLDRGDDEAIFSPKDSVKLKLERGKANRKTPLSCGNAPGRKNDRGGLRGKSAERKPNSRYNTETYCRAIHRACDKAFPPPPPLAQREGESDPARWRRLTEDETEQLKTWQSNHRWGPNRLRHSRGTEIRKQFGLEAAQVTLGHRNADVTQVYAERDEELGKRVAREAG